MTIWAQLYSEKTNLKTGSREAVNFNHYAKALDFLKKQTIIKSDGYNFYFQSETDDFPELRGNDAVLLLPLANDGEMDV